MADDLKQRNERGRSVIRAILGDEFLAKFDAQRANKGFGGESAQLALDFAFGAVWSRPGLDLRSRSLVTIGALIALGKPDDLANHVRAALNNGISIAELEEIIIQTIPYCGFPSAAKAMEVAAAILKERGLDAKSAKDYGTL